MFKLCLSRAELDAAIESLVAAGSVAITRLDGKEAIVAA
jgi:hypothetical protein